MCKRCDENQDFDPNDRATWCNSCVGRAWVYDTESAIEAVVESAGWSITERSGGFNSASRYLTIYRENFDGDFEEFKLRISDHGSAHCSEDISLAMNPGGDDHSIETLTARLAREFIAT